VVIVTIDGDGDPIAPASIEEYAIERGALVARVTDHRELATDERETSISFADPDDAVAERVRDLGLSGAARDIDETVRASKVADANVTETVESRVRELVEESPEALDAAGPVTAAEDGTADGGSAAETDGGASAVESGGPDANDGETAGADGSAADKGTSATDSEPTSEASTDADDDGQSSMEEFL